MTKMTKFCLPHDTSIFWDNFCSHISDLFDAVPFVSPEEDEKELNRLFEEQLAQWQCRSGPDGEVMFESKEAAMAFILAWS